MKRAQIEMMGFVMVVILVTIGMFFMVSLRKEPTTKTTFTVYSDEKLASNFLITLLETNVEGYADVKLHDFAVDCVRQRSGGVGKFSVDACNELQVITQDIFDQTLIQWGYSYVFTFIYTDATSTENPLITLSSPTLCTGELSAPGWQPISLFRVTTGSAVMRLDICV